MERAARISVVMPVFNAEQYVAEAIHSILEQTFEGFEFIIVNDGSTDGTRAILDSFAAKDARIRLYHQANAGVVAALNHACSLARAPYIARMDADDISLPDRLRAQLHYLDNHPDIGVLGTWIQDIGADGTLGPIWPLPTTPATIRWFLMFGNCMAHPSIMARRGVMARLGFYRPEAVHVEDYDLWMRAALVTGLANMPRVLLRYRVVSSSASSRNLPLQEKESENLKRAFIADLLSLRAEDIELGRTDLLLKLYRTYRERLSLNRGDDSEITLDVFRRVCLSRQFGSTPMRLLRYVPRLFSLRAIRKVLQYGTFYVSNVRHGFTTQRRVSP